MDATDLDAAVEFFLGDLDISNSANNTDSSSTSTSDGFTTRTLPPLPMAAPFEMGFLGDHLVFDDQQQQPVNHDELFSQLLLVSPTNTSGLQQHHAPLVDDAVLHDIDMLLAGDGAADHSDSAAGMGTTSIPAGSSSSQLAGSTSSPSSSSEALVTTKKKPKRSPNYNPNKARNERRHELIYLRKKVQEMEQQLTRLGGVESAASTSTVATAAAITTQTAQRQIPSTALRRRLGLWEKIAGRQHSERRRAHRENERLKILLETQLQIATSLENLISKRQKVKTVEDCPLGICTRVFVNPPNQSDPAIFDELLQQAEGSYEEAMRLFDGLGLDDDALSGSCRDARVRDSEKGVFMEIFATDVLPFALHDTSRAAWQYFSHHKNKSPFRLYYERIRESKTLTEDTIVENSALEMHVNHTTAIFRLKQVLRRYVEPDRVVISFSAVAEPYEFATKPFSGCNFREWGCMILTKPRATGSSQDELEPEPESSVLKTCYFITPEFYGDPQASGEYEEVVGELTEFVLSCTSATMTAWFQMIENILVDESLQDRAAQ